MSEFVCILYGPDHERKREPAGELWCFAERKRYPHDWVLLDYGDPPADDDEGWMGWYYEPIWKRECSSCRKDRTHFGDGW